jgi:hypothetical protein
VEINEEEGSAHLDFEGTGAEVRGNLNAPISVVHSAVIYCMRAMLDVDVPLNAGCLVPVTSALAYIYMLFCDENVLGPLMANSQDTGGFPSAPIQDCGCMRWERSHVAEDRRCCFEGI